MKILKVNKSYKIAIVLSGAIVIWMGVGMLYSNETPTNTLPPADTDAEEAVVAVTNRTATLIVHYISAQGTVEPNREVVIRAETAGKIKRILVREGKTVDKGTSLARMDIQERKIRLDQARVQTKAAQRQYDAAKSLGAEGYEAQTRIDDTLTALKISQAEEKRIALELSYTNIRAPFAGIISRRHIEQGDYVMEGAPLMTIVDNSVLVVAVAVPQQDIAAVKENGLAEVVLVNGQTEKGTIRFISPRAAMDTRTFRVEIAIPNTHNLPSGTSAHARIPRQNVMVHLLSPALLTLNPEGDMGIKVINDSSIVEFYPVKIVSSNQKGIYVSGLPQYAQIITQGQGYVRTGDRVSFVYSETYAHY